MSTPIILDCDPGHDDVFAIWLAAAHPNIELRAITTVGGNGQLIHTTQNARIACTVAGIGDVLIAAGAASPLNGELHPADWIHGANALGGPDLPSPSVALDARSALDLMTDVIEGSGESVTIVATGPLTNIGELARDRPDVLAKVERVIWMGGSTGRGNATPYAEFNAWTDPEAIQLVLDSGIDFTMVGLNISHQALITDGVRKQISAIGTNTAAFGRELLDFFCATYDAAEEMPDAPLHDPITIALLADPSVVTTVRSRLDVELLGTETRGATSVDLHGILNRPDNATIALELDVDRFWRMILDAVAALA
ncbi:purine nucleosidase [Microbacterium sp. W4I4]|uniref:nucleoside hydrolase n=1 Tax=Microbacterium sp. W4I4 TaxID=3042295 RepID=UPI002783547E|nr:nucleoside hydrolase [Microbacterium sp. W4I4]MDQ0615639.1 purine nucleosidase [Microbacterium sp. W4I4]